MISIDDRSFDQTAQCVFRLNEPARNEFGSWERLRAFMSVQAHVMEYADSAYFATFGFVLTGFRDETGLFCVNASIAPYLVLNYFEERRNY